MIKFGNIYINPAHIESVEHVGEDHKKHLEIRMQSGKVIDTSWYSDRENDAILAKLETLSGTYEKLFTILKRLNEAGLIDQMVEQMINTGITYHDSREKESTAM